MTDAALLPSADAPLSAAPVISSVHHVETVRWVKHWTDRLFSFGITRPSSFRFRSGEFVMIGLPPRDELGEKKPIMRAYSVASPWFADELEFFSIKVADGPLTSRLQAIAVGDPVLLGKKPTGTLVLDALQPGRRLWLIGTGTGLAPWLSVARDPDAYERHEQVIVCHTVREVKDLAYKDLFSGEIENDELIGELAAGKFAYYPTVTRAAHLPEGVHPGRITDRITSGAIFRDLGIDQTKFDPEIDRIMLCGSMAMIKDVAAILESQGLQEGSNAEPGDFVLERAFVG